MSSMKIKIIFIIYYSLVIFLSINNFNIDELKRLYIFFDDKDKFMHFSQYFLLVMLGLFSFKITINSKSFLFILIFTMTSSGLSEFAQIYLSARDASYIDWFYDIGGGISGFIVFSGVNKLCCKK